MEMEREEERRKGGMRVRVSLVAERDERNANFANFVLDVEDESRLLWVECG